MAQQSWADPEAEILYKQAQDYLKKGSFALAINAYEQAKAREPLRKEIREELGQAYYFAKDYDKAYQTVLPAIANGYASPNAYQVGAASLTKLKELKKAKRLLSDGLDKYPNEGLLYFEYGRLYDDNHEEEEALKYWLKGIAADPGYHVNYYEAARMYANSKEPWWALLYAEVFINLERVTPRADDARKIMLSTYRKLFLKIGEASLASVKTKENPGTFEEAFLKSLKEVAPTLIGGISMENLIMMRARLSGLYEQEYASRFPHSLFGYWSALLRNGYFDVYNQWLLGKVENPSQYQSWMGFHSNVVPGFERWVKANPLKPVKSDNYNDGRTKNLLLPMPGAPKR